jgi:PleD family two-component response regulator
LDELSKQQTLLIVDDARENIIFLAENLRSNYKIRAVTSGQKALDIAFSEEPPDLILLDIEMPDMSGHDVCKRLKESMKTKSIPIIFVTGRINESDEIYGLKLGAVDYITKPFNPYIIKARIDAHAELKRYRDYLESISYVDSLTKIANRRRFDEHLEIMWNVGKRDKIPVSLVMLDIDQFKKYNDTYGHKAGDICLIQVGEALSDVVLRKTDLVARYGGEEFACILPNAGLNDAIMISERLSFSSLSEILTT